MIFEALSVSAGDVRRLLSAANPDAALLYIYLKSENACQNAAGDLNLSESRVSCAAAMLRQLGLWTDEKQPKVLAGERPAYSERDVLAAMETDRDFQSLYGELQRQLGRSLNTEELKILLGFTRYLGLTPDVISVLVNYCKDRQRQKGLNRAPSLRMIEKEAYAWAEKGIETMEEAAAYIQSQNQYNLRMRDIRHLLQIRGRRLTAAEERYAYQWSEMGFDDEAILMAYERTCINTGGLKWPYMNSILKRWHEAGLHTADQVRAGDAKVQPKQERRDLDTDELDAIKRLMQEG